MPRIESHPAGHPIWFDLMTSDAEAARGFYHAILGWDYDISGPEMGHYAMARTDQGMAAGIGQIPPGAGFPPSWTVYFGVADAEAGTKAIEVAGGSTLAPTMEVATFGRMAVCQDPTGAVFGLWQPADHTGAGVVNEPGAMAWCEVNTRDAQRAAEFYTRVFGLRDEPMEMQGTAYHMLHGADGPACGVLQMTAQWGDLPPHWMTYFAVADVEAAKAAVEANGGEVPHGPFDTAYGRMIVARDPQGAVLSFIQLKGEG